MTKQLEFFTKRLNVLKSADFRMANRDAIYRMGVICQFASVFELAWKALQAVLREHGAEQAQIGSPRESLQLGYRYGFLDDEAVWLSMLKKRNAAVHIYSETEADDLILLIRDSFLPAFSALEATLTAKHEEAET